MKFRGTMGMSEIGEQTLLAGGGSDFQSFEVWPIADAVWAFADREPFDFQCYTGVGRQLPITPNCCPQGRLSDEVRPHCSWRTLTYRLYCGPNGAQSPVRFHRIDGKCAYRKPDVTETFLEIWVDIQASTLKFTDSYQLNSAESEVNTYVALGADIEAYPSRDWKTGTW